MKLIKLKAKVRLYSESDLEVQSRDLNIPPPDIWGKRTVAFYASDIYRIVNHSPGTCIIIFNDWEKMLIYESFNQVVNKWQEAIKKEEKKEEELSEDESAEEEDEDEE